MNRSRLALVVLLEALVILGGCQKPAPKSRGLGRPLASASARNLSLAPDGRTLVFIGDVKPPSEKDVPDGVFQGVLTTVPLAGGIPRPLGGGVSTLDDGYRISPDGRHVAYLQEFRFHEQSGSLFLAGLASGEPRLIAKDAKYYAFSSDGRWLGYVAAGDMHLFDLSGGGDRHLVRGAATFEISKDARHLLVRRPAAAGGALLLADIEGGGEPKELGENVGDYAFSPQGDSLAFTSRSGGPSAPYRITCSIVGGHIEKRGEGVSTFRFSPDGRWIAFVDGMGGHKTFGALMVAPVAGGPARRIGENVIEYRFAPSSNAIALRESNEDASGRTWMSFKVATLPSGTLRHREDGVPNFVWSFDGARVAFLKRVMKPVYSVDLFLLDVEGESSPRRIDQGVFGYQFAPDDGELWYRTNCVRDGRECDLMAANVRGASAPPRKLVQGIWNFKATAKGDRLLLTYPRLDTENAADLGWLDLKAKQPSKGIDRYALPGAQFVDESGGAVVYVVGERKREGVYVAELK